MDGRLEYETAIRIAQLEKKLADAQEQYRDILSEYNTLCQNHSRAMDRMHEVEAERNALADWANEVADVVRDKRFGSSHVELALWLGRQVGKAPTNILMRLSKEKAGVMMDEQLSDAVARLKAEWDKAELEPIWETLIKVADLLGIDAEKARSLPGKPSDVYAAYLTRQKLLWQAEALEDVMPEMRDSSREVIYYRLQELRRQAEGVE